MRTYLFDFDGTLVDSMPTFVSCMLQILDEHKISYGKALIKDIAPLGYGGSAQYFVQLGVPATPEELVTIMQKNMREAYAHTVPAKSNVVSTLKALKQQGHSLNVLSGSPHMMIDPCLERLGIQDLFDNVWSCEDFYTDKSNPEIYRMAADKLGRKPENVIFVDDNCIVNKTVKEVGMQAYGVYDEAAHDSVAEMKQIADRYLYNFAELLEDERQCV